MAAPLVRPAATIGGLTVVSRVLGFARDVLSANLLGAGWVMDAFTIALLVPNLFRRLLGEGAMSSAFVPTFVRELEGPGPESARRLLGAVTARLAVALAALVAVGYAATFVIPRLWPGEKAALTVELLRITLPYLLLVCLTAVFGAALNSLRHFAAPAVAPVLVNLLWIGGRGQQGPPRRSSWTTPQKAPWIVPAPGRRVQPRGVPIAWPLRSPLMLGAAISTCATLAQLPQFDRLEK